MREERQRSRRTMTTALWVQGEADVQAVGEGRSSRVDHGLSHGWAHTRGKLLWRPDRGPSYHERLRSRDYKRYCCCASAPTSATSVYPASAAPPTTDRYS